MIEFDFAELNLLNKLLSKIKYSELDIYELNQLAYNPIINSVMEKIRTEFMPEAEKVPRIGNRPLPKFNFEFESHIGNNLKKRLEYTDISSWKVIVEWDKTQTEKYARNILGPINYEQTELNKLTEYLMKIAAEKTCG
ncbi:hypothetical protein [Zobellia nedashkovskayae]|uniref:hypothetical protein n=1 Tax=Zobellia nedashkovskayae TaxID=2779510 RepID=UPI00188AB2FC|nr:hypothetical protein [Zobellia nedashkovskayae]